MDSDDDLYFSCGVEISFFFNSVKIPGRALAARLAARTVSKTVHMAPQDAPLFFLRARRQNPFLSENEHILIFHDVKGHALGVFWGCSGDVLGTLWPGPGNLFKNALFPNPGVFLAGFCRSGRACRLIFLMISPLGRSRLESRTAQVLKTAPERESECDLANF